MMLELREGGKNVMIKVTNPAKPGEYFYLRDDIYAHCVNAAENGMSGFFQNLWHSATSVISNIKNGVMNIVGNLTGGGGSQQPGGGSGGGLSSILSGLQGSVPIINGANGQPSVYMTTQPPPVAFPPQVVKDNTMLYVGIAAAAVLVLPKLMK